MAAPRSLTAVIADDLTGASDAGVQFARRGRRTIVVLDRLEPRLVADAQAIAVDTDSRGLSAEAAYARVLQVGQQIRHLEPDVVYKKIDSTLRGNLAAEIDALMDAFDFALAMIAPAYPAQARTTRGGVHYLRGVPVPDADLVRVLRGGSRREVGHLGFETVRAGIDFIRTELERFTVGGVALVVCDAETEVDLRAIADSTAHRRDVLWVGSAGLAEQLVESRGFAVRAPADAWCGVDGPILVVAGSTSEVTRRQVAYLSGHARRHDVDQRAELAATLNDGRDAVLVGWSESLARLVADCVRAQRVGGLVLTGGETARAVCRELGVVAIQLVDEVEPGVPLGLLLGSTPDRLPVVTKAGAFGSDTTLRHAIRKLTGGNIT